MMAKPLLSRLQIQQHKDKKINNISGGECQRAAIARALVHKPQVVFADEPTAALDKKNAKEVMKIFKEYSKSSLILVVTHDTSLFEYLDYKITLLDGKIVSG